MQEKKPPAREQVTKTVRLSNTADKAVADLAMETGASYNSTICLLIRLGLREFTSE